jgi:tetratricopeptide (TPR) repeat protein
MVVLAVNSMAAASPPEAYSKGLALVEQGELRDALYALADAVRGDRANQQYIQQFMLVRQALVYENALASETNPQRWLQIAQALRSFYVSVDAHAQALKLDRQIHQREASAGSAVQLAETLLALDKNADAADTLTALDEASATPATRALLGIALARQGKIDQAREVTAGIETSADTGPGTYYCVARAHAASGDSDAALTLLTRCFETTPPSRLAALKSHAQKSPEFAPLASKPRFSEVMETASKVVESKCSGGSSCAGCPMRGQCASDED